MATKVKNSETETCLREILRAEGYRLSPKRGNGETGVDIIAERGVECFHIEVIGYKASGPARAKDFYEVFFRAVSRLDDGAQQCVIAVPHHAKVGLPARANQHRTAWTRIAKEFPELSIWLVNVEDGMYERSRWEDWLGAAGDAAGTASSS